MPANIRALSDQKLIDWPATWSLFGFHINNKKSSTNFKHSNRIVFNSKMLMDELPLLDKLVRRRPDLYKSDWKCIMCNQEQETWSHLWQCTHIHARIRAIVGTTRNALLLLLGESIPNLSANFISSFNNLPCWNLPSTSHPNISNVSFDMLTKGFVPTALTDLLSTVANQKEKSTYINSIISTAQLIFHDEIWNYRCELFNEWERSKGITPQLKKDSSSGFIRNSVSTTNASRASTVNRWKTWIDQSIDTGRPWMGFRIHINSLVACLVQHLKI